MTLFTVSVGNGSQSRGQLGTGPPGPAARTWKTALGRKIYYIIVLIADEREGKEDGCLRSFTFQSHSCVFILCDKDGLF